MDPERIEELWPVPGLPRSATYEPGWWMRWCMGPNVLWLTESLSQVLEIRPGMRVLDLGCGAALSSIFLAKEFGCRVWATDLWVRPDGNWQRVQEAGVDDLVTPLYAEAHALPFADGFFDLIVSIDAYHYFGTDELYLGQLSPLVREGGRIGIIVPGHAADDGRAELSFHSDKWWARLWARTKGVVVERSEMLPEGHDLWVRSDAVGRAWEGDAPVLPQADDFLDSEVGLGYGFVRLVARVGDQ